MQHGDSALRNWLEVPKRSCLSWILKAEYELLRQLGWWGILQTVRSYWKHIKVFCCWLAACCICELPFPWGMQVCLQPSAQVLPFLPSVKTPRKFHLYQEEPAWLIPTYLLLLQLRQHSNFEITSYLRVILLYKFFVLFWNLWHLKNRPAFQATTEYQIPTLCRELCHIYHTWP